MPRSATASELTLLAAVQYVKSVRVLIKDTESVWRHLSGDPNYIDISGTKQYGGASTQGLDWIAGYDIDRDNDRPIDQLTVRIRREVRSGSALSLSPLRTDSVANRKADTTTFQSIVDVARSIRFEEAYTKPSFNPNQQLQTDGGLEVSAGVGWTLESNWSVVNDGNAHTGGFALKKTSANSAAARNPSLIPCNPGDKIYAEGWMKGVSSANGTARIRLSWRDSGGAELSVTNGSSVTSDNAYHLSTVLGTAPASTVYVVPEFEVASQTTGTWYADDMLCLWASWKRLFEGSIDSVEFNHEPMVVTCRDLGAELVDRWTGYPQEWTNRSVAIETLIQEILTRAFDPDTAPSLYTPVSPSTNVTTFKHDRESIFDIIQRLSASIGWDLRYMWDDGTNAYRLTFFDPNRSKSTPDVTIASGQYVDVTQLAIDRTTIRNQIYVLGKKDGFGIAEDSTSIARYGKRTVVIQEGDDTPIDTNAEGQAMADAILADLKDPKAEQSVEMLPYWPVELHDLVRFSANGTHYDNNQDLAIVRIRHTGSVDSDGQTQHRTIVDVRGKPALGPSVWLGLPWTGRPRKLPPLAPVGADSADTGVRPSTRAAYLFTEGEGTKVTDQVITVQSPLVLQSNAGWTTAAKGGSIYDFDGSSSRDAKATHETAYDIGGGADFTIDLVFRYDGDLGQAQYLVNHENDYRLAINTSGQLVYRVRDHWADNTVTAIDFSAQSFSPGTFLHLKFTYAQGSSLATIYINGEVRATHTATGSSTGSAISDDLHIGSFAGQTNDGVLNGAMSYLRISSGLQSDFPMLPVPRRNRCKVGKSSTQSITQNTLTALTFDTETYDLNAMHDSGDNTKISIPADGNIGIYILTAQVVWASDSTGDRYVQITKNGSTALGYARIAASTFSEQNVSGIDDAPAVGDYYEVKVQQSTAGALNAADSCTFAATQIL